jgi:hypothetical protein
MNPARSRAMALAGRSPVIKPMKALPRRILRYLAVQKRWAVG